MTDETTTEDVRGALGAGDDVAHPLSDITTMIHATEAQLDLHEVGETASIWLAHARDALRSELQYVRRDLT